MTIFFSDKNGKVLMSFTLRVYTAYICPLCSGTLNPHNRVKHKFTWILYLHDIIKKSTRRTTTILDVLHWLTKFKETTIRRNRVLVDQKV